MQRFATAITAIIVLAVIISVLSQACAMLDTNEVCYTPSYRERGCWAWETPDR